MPKRLIGEGAGAGAGSGIVLLRQLTMACTRPRIIKSLIENLSVITLNARRVMPGVRFPKRSMYFWRDTYFKALTEAANYASAIPVWTEYARFCELLEKGLRKDAFAHLERFIESAAGWPLSEKKRFVSWLYNFAYEHRDGSYLLMPHPLQVKFLEPTLAEWVVLEPESGEPHRWLGTSDHLKEAIKLDPADEIARERLANYILAGVGNSLSHVSCCKYYPGNAEEDLQSLERVGPLIERLSDEEIRAQYYVEAAELWEGVKDYLRSKTET